MKHLKKLYKLMDMLWQNIFLLAKGETNVVLVIMACGVFRYWGSSELVILVKSQRFFS